MRKLISLIISTCILLQPIAVNGEVLMSNTKAKISNNTANIVKFDPTKVTPTIVTASNSVVDDKSVSSMISKNNVVSAINGGFFNSYYNSGKTIAFPDNCAKVYATLIKDGKLINGGGNDNTIIGFDASGNAIVDKVDIKSQVNFNDKFDILVWGVNNNYGGEPTMYFTSEMTLPVNISSSYTNIYIKDNQVTKIEKGGKFTVPKGTSVLVVPNSIMERNEGFGRYIAVGDKAVFSYEIQPENTDISKWKNVTQAMGGGALLVAKGKNVASNNTYSDPKQAPNTVLQRSFIGVTSKGQIIMGESVSSFNDIANYLVKQDVTEAIALDGGASSMLYSNGSYLQSAGRELASVLTFNKKDNSGISAVKTDSKILIDGEEVALPAYTIQGNTYFKLRDLAYYLADTDMKFAMGYDSEKGAILIVAGEEYDKNDHTFSENTAVAAAKKSTYPTYINDTKYDFTAYVIGGNTHYKLRDIGDALGFKVGYNTDLGQIEIKTK